MAKYAANPFTKKQSERRISQRKFSDAEVPNVTGISSGLAGYMNCTLSGYEGTNGQLATLTVYLNPNSNIGEGATFQWYMAPSGRIINNCTNTYAKPVTNATGRITGGVSSFSYNRNNTALWTDAQLNGYWVNNNQDIPIDYYGWAAFYKCCVTNSAGSGCSPWVPVYIAQPYNCNCTCPAGYVEACCCFDCSGDGITCCDDPPGNPVSNCCRGECPPGDPGYACGYDCPGGESCDTCYNCTEPMNVLACS